MKEIWRDIPGYKGYYQVSDQGSVKSVERIVKSVKNRTRIIKSKAMVPVIGTTGYYAVHLSKLSKRRMMSVHQLVAIAFLDHVPNGYELVVNHKNFNRLDNRVENLEITTQRENANRKHCKGTSKYTGVHWNKASNKWRSSIVVNGTVEYLGYFDDEQEASEAYEKRKTEVVSNIK